MSNKPIVYAGLAALFIAVAGGGWYIITKSSSQANAATPTGTPIQQALAPKPEDIGMGDPNAPIKMIEYASSGCIHCADVAMEILPKIKKDYIDTGKVYYVLRDFPLDGISAAASLIARCLPKEQFYPFMDILFENQDKWHTNQVPDVKEAVITLARRTGISREQAEACMKDEAKYKRMTEIQQEAQDVLKLSGTPMIWLDGQLFEFKVPMGYDQVDAKLKELLAAKGK